MNEHTVLFFTRATRLLAGITAALLVYVIYAVFSIYKTPFSMNSTTQHRNAAAVSVELPSVERGDFKAYVDVLTKRDFFATPYEQRIKNDTTPGDSQDGNAAAGLLNNFKVVGIILDGNPQAIIEDQRNNETLFLSVGGKIGDAVLSEIKEGKAVFLCGDQRRELSPR